MHKHIVRHKMPLDISFSITEVRFGLNHIRNMKQQHNPFAPMNTTQILIRDMTVEEFAFNLLSENKQKRRPISKQEITN